MNYVEDDNKLEQMTTSYVADEDYNNISIYLSLVFTSTSYDFSCVCVCWARVINSDGEEGVWWWVATG